MMPIERAELITQDMEMTVTFACQQLIDSGATRSARSLARR